MLWIVSVAVMEWGYLLALIALLMIVLPPRRGAWARLSTLLNLGTAALALSPIARAIPIARTLPTRVATFGDTTEGATGDTTQRSLHGTLPRSTPLSLTRLVRAPTAPGVIVSTERFAAHPDGDLYVDVYRRPNAGSAPLVLAVHGGSWSGGTRHDLAPLNNYLAARGYVVASPDYRFAPQHPFPAARDDLRETIAYLRANATRLGIDPARVVMMGRSAGGELALLVAYTTPDVGIRGAVGYYAPSDLRYGFVHPSNPRVLNSTRVLEQYLSGTPTTAGDAYDAASPITFASTAVPTLLMHGDSDELVSVMQSVRLDSSLGRAGRPHLLLRLPWATHGCDYNFAGPCAQLATFALERFLAAVTR